MIAVLFAGDGKELFMLTKICQMLKISLKFFNGKPHIL